jgi:hypothetical protein
MHMFTYAVCSIILFVHKLVLAEMSYFFSWYFVTFLGFINDYDRFIHIFFNYCPCDDWIMGVGGGGMSFDGFSRVLEIKHEALSTGYLKSSSL